MNRELLDLIEAEGWKVHREGSEYFTEVYGEKFKVRHPFAIHLKLYRESTNPDMKFRHLKAAHDHLWPSHRITWNKWTEERFYTHCEDWRIITYAGGGNIGKSFDAAKIGILYWLADPLERGVLVMSTTLESLESRIYGYCLDLLSKAALPLEHRIRRGNNQRIEWPGVANTVHSIRAVAARRGDTEEAIKNIIGRHPNKGLLVIADELPDLPLALMAAIPNLEKNVYFQMLGIGNPNSPFDPHGALSKPKNGWESIDPKVHTRWETQQERGLCLFFSCYNSPAIYETDPDKKAALSKFLMTAAEIEKAERTYGKDSLTFYRFTLGFWQFKSTTETVLSKDFVKDFRLQATPEWSGQVPITYVAGLDVAFSTGGDKVILRLAKLGQTTAGLMVLDYEGDKLRFEIPISATAGKAAEFQIADAVIKILRDFGIPLCNVAMDSNGQGRAMGGLIQERMKSHVAPLKIYSVQAGNRVKNSFDVVIKTTLELWMDFRDFVQHDQIRGLDYAALQQFTQRRIKVSPTTGKLILEPKAEYKMRMAAENPAQAHSPDEADSCALALQAAKIKLGFYPGQMVEMVRSQVSWSDEKIDAYLNAKKAEIEGRTPGMIRGTPKADFTVAGLGSSGFFRPPGMQEGVQNTLESALNQKRGLIGR